MGLLLGGSALTIIELFDLLIYNGLRKLMDRRRSGRKHEAEAEEQQQNQVNHDDKKRMTEWTASDYMPPMTQQPDMHFKI